MEILHELGFQWTLFIAQIVNFLIIAWVFKRYLYKPLLKILRERENKIRRGVEDSERAKLELANAEQSRAEILKKASQEAEKIISGVRLEAEQVKNQILENAKHEAEKIIESGREQALLERKEMETTAKNAGIDVAERVVASVLSKLFTKQEKQTIVKRGMSAIKNA